MSKLRVYELARELNIETKVLMTRLKGSNVKVASHQSTLTDQEIEEIKMLVGANGSTSASPSPTAKTVVRPVAESAASSAAKPTVIIRRRAAAEPEVEKVEEPAKVAAPEVQPETVVRRKAPEPVVEKPVEAAPEKPVVKPVVKPAETTKVEAAPSVTLAPVVEVAPVVAPIEPEVEAEEEVEQVAASAPEKEAPAPARKRETVGGATIVRRATAAEVEDLESKNKKKPGRKEDHRGTRVTGMGLLSNRMTAPEGSDAPASNKPPVRESRQGGQSPSGQGGPAPAPREKIEKMDSETDEAWAIRKAKDRKKESEEEEARRKAAAAKSKRSASGFTTRALLSQFSTSEDDDEKVSTDPYGKTVFTPQAPRNKRDLKRRKDLKKTQITVPRASYRVVEMGETITVGELARGMAIKAADIIKKLMAQGIMATINQEVDFDTASILASEHNYEIVQNIASVDDILQSEKAMDVGANQRPPIVTVMGHVDHGKTSILDAIRKSNVASGEAGGITQHIGAYSVMHGDHSITFLDTPGHEAFSSMRARGAKVTDIVVLVVAADDGVMPQTIEAISHAKDAKVPLIVAVNKIDKHNVNFDRVYTELTEHGIQAEEWGGETQFVKCSALKGIGIDELLEAIVLQAEVLDLRASEEGRAEGAVIEAHLDKGRGPVATLVVQRGTLVPGDFVVCGTEIGRVRAMVDHNGVQLKKAGPSQAVEIIGLSGVPMAGDMFNVVQDERTAREAADFRSEQVRRDASRKSSAATLEDLLARVKSEDVPEVPIIVKGDTQGSVQAICESIVKLSTPKVRNKIIHSAVGGVTESDLTLASASKAIVIAFNVRAARGMEDYAEKAGVLIRYFNIIYDIVDALKSIMVGKLPPIINEVVTGHAEVRKTISVPKMGTVAGSAVTDGKITRNAHCRLIRDSIVVYQGKLGSLRRFKDDVKEVVQGYECGIGIEGYNDVKEGDVIEAYVLEETAATL
jgi:translation initiation factor IF-2